LRIEATDVEQKYNPVASTQRQSTSWSIKRSVRNTYQA
jgi:hypothetical protein